MEEMEVGEEWERLLYDVVKAGGISSQTSAIHTPHPFNITQLNTTPTTEQTSSRLQNPVPVLGVWGSTNAFLNQEIQPPSSSYFLPFQQEHRRL